MEDAEHLVGLSLGEAFRVFVLEHPEIRSLGEEIIKQKNGHREVFFDGRYPGIGVPYKWPLFITPNDLADRFEPYFLVIPGPPPPKPSAAIQQVSKVFVQRLSALRDLLVTGRVVASGTFVKSGEFTPIHRAQWSRQNIWIDVKSSDLAEEIDHHPVVLWTGVMLERPAPEEEMFHVKTTTSAPLRSSSQPSNDKPTPKPTALHASTEQAIAALWPDGIPDAMLAKVRDQEIMEWQKAHKKAVASSKTIRRYLASKRTS